MCRSSRGLRPHLPLCCLWWRQPWRVARREEDQVLAQRLFWSMRCPNLGSAVPSDNYRASSGGLHPRHDRGMWPRQPGGRQRAHLAHRGASQRCIHDFSHPRSWVRYCPIGCALSVAPSHHGHLMLPCICCHFLKLELLANYVLSASVWIPCPSCQMIPA